jgi:hypothetical protein
MHRIFATAVVGVFLLSVRTAGATRSCQELPLKPVHCVRGAVIDPSGAPVANATVKIFKHGTELAALQTREDGKFSYDRSSAGNYDIQVQAAGFEDLRFSVVVGKPNSRCKRALEVRLSVGGLENCNPVRLVKR